MQNKKRISLIISMLAVLSFAGLGSAGQEGAATIEELLERCKSADSIGAQIPLMHPDSRPIWGSMLHEVSASKLEDTEKGIGAGAKPIGLPEEAEARSTFLEELNAAFEAINERHGLTPSPAGQTPDEFEQFDGVDVIAYVLEIEQWMIETFGPIVLEGWAPDLSTLDNLQVENDRATAKTVLQEFIFVREGDIWYWMAP